MGLGKILEGAFIGIVGTGTAAASIGAEKRLRKSANYQSGDLIYNIIDKIKGHDVVVKKHWWSKKQVINTKDLRKKEKKEGK